MGEQFHNRKHKIVRGREDVGWSCPRSVLCVEAKQYAGTLTEDNASRIGCLRRGLSQEIFQFLPTFLAGILNIDVDDVVSL